jgi:AraC-like DNA-binding protein
LHKPCRFAKILSNLSKRISFSDMSRGKQLLAGRPARCWQRSNRRRFGTFPEEHEELVALFATRGQMSYLIDGQIALMRPGVLLFAFAGQAHVLLSESRDFDMWVFLVSGDFLPQQFRKNTLPPLTRTEAADHHGPRLLPPKAREELGMLAEIVSGEEDQKRKEFGIRWWLGRAWKHWTEAGPETSRHVHPALDQAVLSIRRDPSQSLEDLANDAGMSVDRLGQLFRKEMKEGFVAFRNRTRLSRLDEVIETQTNLNLLEAALEAGFGSYPQFFRVFKKLRGVSPYAYYKDDGLITGAANDSELQ